MYPGQISSCNEPSIDISYYLSNSFSWLQTIPTKSWGKNAINTSNLRDSIAENNLLYSQSIVTLLRKKLERNKNQASVHNFRFICAYEYNAYRTRTWIKG